jgi:hypothetical protein
MKQQRVLYSLDCRKPPPKVRATARKAASKVSKIPDEVLDPPPAMCVHCTLYVAHPNVLSLPSVNKM